MSRVLRLPLVIHEQNAIPGLTNRWLARIATRVLEAFPGSFAHSVKAQESGNPVRVEIEAKDGGPLIDSLMGLTLSEAERRNWRMDQRHLLRSMRTRD